MGVIKILSWNVEHFDSDKQVEIAQIIKGYDPDVFGIYEVEAASVYTFMKAHFPKYTVFITEGQQSQEILVACKNKNQFIGVKFQQKTEFKSGNPSLRPGAFLTFEYAQKGQFNFLFLHTDSGSTAVDFGNRTEMFDHAYNLKRKLDFDSNSKVNFIILGDLNTMGLKYPRPYQSDKIVETPEELEYLDFYSNRSGGTKGYKKVKPALRRLTKPAGTYYSKSYGISDLDHIIASDHLQFVGQSNYGEPNSMDIKLDGWRKHLGNQAEIEKYIEEISDHCLLYCELKV
jgi:exonuclease III